MLSKKFQSEKKFNTTVSKIEKIAKSDTPPDHCPSFGKNPKNSP